MFMVFLYMIIPCYNYYMKDKDIKLRKIKKSDSRYFLKWWKDKDLIKLTSGIYEKSDKVLESYFFDMLKSKVNRYYLILLNSKSIGNISISKINNSTFEMQIIIGDKKYLSKGFGKVAIQKALVIAFNRLKYKKAYLEVRPDNLRAIKAYQNCGFKKLGLKRNSKNKYQPVVLKMGLAKKDFKIRKYATVL